MKIALKLVGVVEVRGVSVPYSKMDINNVLGCTFQYTHDLTYMLNLKILNNIEAWLAPMISIVAYSWLDEGALIEKKELWIGFISSNLMPSQNESIF